MLDPKIESRVNQMAEHTATLTGVIKEEYMEFCIKTIKNLCGEVNMDCKGYIKHYWSVYQNEIFERETGVQ